MGRSLQSQRNQYVKDNPNAANIFEADPEQIKRYAELHGLMRSAFTRTIVGSAVMAGFILSAMAKGDDDDEEEVEGFIANLMKSRSGRALMQKFLPVAVAMLAPFLYEDEKGRKGLANVIEMLVNYLGTEAGSWGTFLRNIKKAKTEEDYNKTLGALAGGTLPTYNVNQAEQIQKFVDVMKSAMDSKKLEDVENDEEITRDIYRETEGFIDNLFRSGIIDAVTRPDFNRYDAKSKAEAGY
jgi:hypothetical protein